MTTPDPAASDPVSEPHPPLRPYHLLAAVPVLGMLGGVPFANRVEPYVLGLPFLLAWIVLWILLTSAVLGIIYALDEAALRARAGTGPSDPAEGPR